MANPLFIPVTPAAMLAAVACVVAGGPWFADGLRALRQRRALAALRGGDGAPLAEGPVTARGTVVLSSPLFAPLSGRPCAGYVLEVGSPLSTLVGRVSDTRGFRLATGDGLVEVDAAGGDWRMAIGSERTVESAAGLSANLAVLLGSTPELRWLVARGGTLVLRERALLSGAQAVVMGIATRNAQAAVAATASVERVRTGTGGESWVVSEEPAGTGPVPGWNLGPAEPFERCIVGDGTAESARFAPPAWRVAGAVLGPALSLAGMLVLAEAAGRVFDGGF